MSVFELSIEVRPQPGNSERSNAWVYVYLHETDIEATLASMKKVLARDLYEVVDIEHIARLDLDEYRQRDENFPDRATLQALKPGESAYGPFFTLL